MEKNFRSSFVIAAEKGNAVEVMKSLKAFRELSTKQERLYYALYIAAFNGHEEVVSILLAKGVDPNFTVGSYLPPLHAAAQKGHEKIVELLLNHGANVNPKLKITSGKKSVTTDYFSSPLLVAARNSHGNVVRLLLQKGANVNVKLHSKSEKVTDDFEKLLTFGNYSNYDLSKDNRQLGFTPLHFAIRYSRKNIVNMLLQHGADINARCDIDLTPLAIACETKDESLINILLKAGADMKAQISHGKPLLRYILHDIFYSSLGDGYDGYDKNAEIEKNAAFRLMLKLGADPNGWSKRKKENIIHYAVQMGMVNAVHLLLKYGVDLNALDGNRKTALQYAVSHLQEILKDVQDEYCYAAESDSDDDYCRRDYFTDSSEEEAYERERDEREKEREEERKRQFENRKIYNLAHKKYEYNVWQYRYNLNHQEGFSVINDPDPYRMIAQLLTRELVRLEVTGKKIVKQNADMLQTAFVKPYYTRCKNEIKKLKKTAVIDGVSYYDLLVAGDSKLAEFVGKKKILEAAQKENCGNLFPNYARFLKLNLKRGLKRKHPDDEKESMGSSDEEEVKASVQKKGKAKRRRYSRDDCVVC